MLDIFITPPLEMDLHKVKAMLTLHRYVFILCYHMLARQLNTIEPSKLWVPLPQTFSHLNSALFHRICPARFTFILCLRCLFNSTTTQRCSRYSTDTVSEFHAEAPQATASEGLAQGPYVADRAGFEPATLQTKGDKSANEPPRPTAVMK